MPQSTITIPRDPRPLPTHFNLDPVPSTYISCLKCHCLYPYTLSTADSIPEKCTFQQAPASTPCSADLWKRVKKGPLGEISVPIRKYLHRTLKSWLGRLLSRPGMERLIHDYPRSLLDAHDVNVADPGVYSGGSQTRDIIDIYHRRQQVASPAP